MCLQAELLVVVAACGLFIKLALLPTLVHRLGEQWLLVLGLSAYALQVRGRGALWVPVCVSGLSWHCTSRVGSTFI